MYDNLKYIIVEKYDLEIPIIFPHFLQHKEVVPYGLRVVSAGKIEFKIIDGTIQAVAFGESVGLNLISRGEDTVMINKFLNNQ